MEFSTIDHIVHFSGGASSYLASKRVIERYGVDSVLLLTADTRSEADDWEDFILSAVDFLGAHHLMLSRGMDLWELAESMNAIPNNRMGFCTRILKKELLDEFIAEHFQGRRVTQHFGFDWSEEHRLDRLRLRKPDDIIDAPLLWNPIAGHEEAMEAIIEDELPVPMAYALGLPHNNCLKYGCVKGGQGYWKQLYEKLPEVFYRTEERERELRKRIGNYSILTWTNDGRKMPLPLGDFRELLEYEESLELDDLGPGCGCFTGEI